MQPKHIPVIASLLLFINLTSTLHAQTCNTGKLDPKVAAFIKMMPVDTQTVEELKQTTNFEQYKKDGPPAMPYPASDVQRKKITADSIPVVVFNPAHEKGIPIIVQYHGGGFIQPLTPWMESFFW